MEPITPRTGFDIPEGEAEAADMEQIDTETSGLGGSSKPQAEPREDEPEPEPAPKSEPKAADK